MIPTNTIIEKSINDQAAGVDEVGRGCLAGPVFAAAVILKKHQTIQGLKDSKQLTPLQRENLLPHIQEASLAWAIGRAEVKEIDEINIFQASLLAMKRAIQALPIVPQHVWVDGTHCPKNLICSSEAVIGGDRLIPAISAASVIAKVWRDREMIQWDKIYPDYGFAFHKGYATPQHRDAIQRLGLTPLHRRSFRVKAL